MKRKKVTEFLILLSTRGVWVRKWLCEYTNEENDGRVMRNACILHSVLLQAYEENRTSLFSQKNASKPLPVHLLSPATTIKLPPEADDGAPEEFLLSLKVKSRLAFTQLMRLTKVEEPATAIENALCLHYDLLTRYLRSETFFIRNGRTSQFERVGLFTVE